MLLCQYQVSGTESRSRVLVEHMSSRPYQVSIIYSRPSLLGSDTTATDERSLAIVARGELHFSWQVDRQFAHAE